MFRLKTIGLATSLCFLVYGCAVGPDFEEPEVQLADSFVEASPPDYVADPVAIALPPV